MNTKVMKKLNLANSLLGMGCMRLPTKEDGSIDYAHGEKMIDYALENGITYFDTAAFYHGGESERFVGKVLSARHPRDKYTIATKLPLGRLNTLEDCKASLATALEKLQTNYIDFYLMHGMGLDSYLKFKEMGTLTWMEELKAAGTIRHICFSTHDTPENVIKILEDYPFEMVQIQLNYLDWELQDAKTLYNYLAEHDIPLVVMEPVRGGRLMTLGGKKVDEMRALDPSASMAKWALRFVGDLPGVSVVLSGMSSMEQLEENVATFSPFVPLSEEESKAIKAVRDEVMAIPFVPCTGCNYCDVCPQQINIPGIFTAYNEYLRFGDKGRLARMKDELAKCIGCGACVQQCPQHIEIPEQLAKALEAVKD